MSLATKLRRQLRMERKARGVCNACGDKPATRGINCEDCANAARERQRIKSVQRVPTFDDFLRSVGED